MKKKIFLSLILLSFFQFSFAQHITVSAPSVVEVDETFQLIYTANAQLKNFPGPNISNFEVLAGPSKSTMSSTNYINGKRTHTYQNSYTYVLIPKKVGKFTIPAFTCVAGSENVVADAVDIEVIKASTKSKSQSPTNSNKNSSSNVSSSHISADDIVLDLKLSKSKVVKGESIVATLKLYSKVNISGFENVKLPEFNGFWNQEIGTPQQIVFQREKYNGQIYSAALIKKYILIPQMSGPIKINPAEMVCLVQVVGNSGGGSVFDDFFDNYKTVRKRVKTPILTVNAKELPSGKPASFSGAVGSFTMQVNMSKDSISSNEAASLMVKINGSGNLNLIEAPVVTLPPDFESYDVKRTNNTKSSIKGLTGTEIFEYPFIARSAGKFTIPAIKFSYYDVNKRRYIIRQSNPIAFDVKYSKKSDTYSTGVIVNKQSVKNLGEDIRFISTNANSLKKNNVMLVASPTFYILFVAICFIFMILYFVLNRIIKRRADLSGMRNRKAKKLARVRLKKCSILLKQELYSAFYEEMHKAIMDYIADKLMLPVVNLNHETIETELKKKGNKDEDIKSLFDLIETCEYARYAPSTGYEAMDQHYKEAVRIISTLAIK
ncbi:MAG: BatD family protein [Bacteroidales bacterium]